MTPWDYKFIKMMELNKSKAAQILSCYSNVEELTKGGQGSGRHTGPLKTHPQYTESDYKHLKGKGYSHQEIRDIWDRDHASQNQPLHYIDGNKQS